MKEEIYWHFRSHKSIYWCCFLLVVILTVIFAVNEGLKNRAVGQRELVRNWPAVKAQIIESKVTFVNTSSKGSFGGIYHVSLLTWYDSEEADKRVEARVHGHWQYRQDIGGVDQFEVGKIITLRVKPGNPERASLIEITGTI